MQLKNVIDGRLNGVIALMYDAKHVAIPGNLLFIPIPGRRFLLNKLLDAGVGSDDAFNRVRRLRALYFGNLNQLFEFVRSLFQLYLLLSGCSIDCRNIAQQLGIPFLLSHC